MIEIKAPAAYTIPSDGITIFLAGSIEMGDAENWQERLKKDLSNFDVIILNPLRDDWDSTWKQSIHNKKFREQVEWELKALERSDFICMYFDPDTKSPITLLELGLFIKEKREKMIVCCPPGYWRKGNVEVVCNWYGATLTSFYNNFVELIKIYIIEMIIETERNYKCPEIPQKA